MPVWSSPAREPLLQSMSARSILARSGSGPNSIKLIFGISLVLGRFSEGPRSTLLGRRGPRCECKRNNISLCSLASVRPTFTVLFEFFPCCWALVNGCSSSGSEWSQCFLLVLLYPLAFYVQRDMSSSTALGAQVTSASSTRKGHWAMRVSSKFVLVTCLAALSPPKPLRQL